MLNGNVNSCKCNGVCVRNVYGCQPREWNVTILYCNVPICCDNYAFGWIFIFSLMWKWVWWMSLVVNSLWVGEMKNSTKTRFYYNTSLRFTDSQLIFSSFFLFFTYSTLSLFPPLDLFPCILSSSFLFSFLAIGRLLNLKYTSSRKIPRSNAIEINIALARIKTKL